MRYNFFILFSLVLFTGIACTKDDPPPAEIILPEVETIKVLPAESWNGNHYYRYVYVAMGNVISDGESDSTRRGICYSQVSQAPTKLDSVSMAGLGEGNFECILELKPGRVKYYIRAFAENTAGISYGQTISHFTECFKDGDVGFLVGGYLRILYPEYHTNVPVSVTLRWNGYGGGFLYDVYLDQNSTPVTLIAADLTTTSFDINGLSVSSTYYWKVVMRNPALSCAMWSTPVTKFSTGTGK